MSARSTWTFAVEGAGEFPFEMLRHDRCWPASAADARSMALHPAGGDSDALRTRYVCLETSLTRAPSRTAWRAKGWPIID